ncbi:MAG: hypothetical protein H0Z28_11220 [Archaeoglobus sp.]|nr:hypothetical protein [Archaeoglobus sp.]
MIKKTVSEIDWYIEGYTVKSDGTIDIRVAAKNPYFNACSVPYLKFKNPADGLWYTGTIVNDIDNISLTGRYKVFSIIWNAVKDLRCMQKYENVEIAIQLNDRPSLGGTPTEVKTLVIDVIDFTLSPFSEIITPYSNDPYFQVKFKSPVTLSGSRIHFHIEMAQDPDFSNIVFECDTQEDTTGWECDGGAFPIDGVVGTEEHIISFSSDAIANLPEGNYYIRIIPVVSNFLPQITEPQDGQVYIGTEINITGNIIVFDE